MNLLLLLNIVLCFHSVFFLPFFYFCFLCCTYMYNIYLCLSDPAYKLKILPRIMYETTLKKRIRSPHTIVTFTVSSFIICAI